MKRTAASILLAAAALAAAGQRRASAKVRTVTIPYTDGTAVMEGYVAYDDALRGRRPGVIVFPEWWGPNDYAKRRARQLASLGYVALVADVYGKGVRPRTTEAAARLAAAYKKDRALLRRRAAAALRALKGQHLVDAGKVAAVGYCFGGTCALELARSGADVKAVVSFHGGLSTTRPARPGQVRAKVLVLHGADDPFVPPAEVAAFQREMRAARADWQMHSYGGAVHSFTNPAAGRDPSRGAAYNKRAAERSWAAMKVSLAEAIGLPRWDGDSGGGAGAFLQDKVARPVGKAGVATGKAVGKAGVATGKAVKRAATWVWDKLKGNEGN